MATAPPIEREPGGKMGNMSSQARVSGVFHHSSRPSARPPVELNARRISGRTKVARWRKTPRYAEIGEERETASLSGNPHESTPPHVHG